jgi:hypothetical protein
MLPKFKRHEKIYLLGYHTQEDRNTVLTQPIKGQPKKAWLGVGYYFWLDEKFAHYWGQDFKTSRTGAYSIYTAYIEMDNLLNASFYEADYFLFKKSIDEAIKHLKTLGYRDVTLSQVHRYLADRIWTQNNVKGIIYDDLPQNPDQKDRVYSEIAPLYYEKRIQVVVFDLSIIHRFQLYLDKQQ